MGRMGLFLWDLWGGAAPLCPIGPLHSGLALSALLRLDSGAAVPLLSVRDGAVGQHFGVRVGPTSLTLFYGADDGNGDGDGDGDGDGRPIAQHRVHFSNVRIADGRYGMGPIAPHSAP